MIVAQQEILVLRMDIDQAVSQFLQDGKRYGRIVDKSSRLAGSEQFAPEDTGGRIKLQVVVEEEAVELIFRDVESRLDDTFAGTFLYAFVIGSLSEHQTQGAEDDRLSGAGLARDYRESVIEADV